MLKAFILLASVAAITPSAQLRGTTDSHRRLQASAMMARSSMQRSASMNASHHHRPPPSMTLHSTGQHPPPVSSRASSSHYQYPDAPPSLRSVPSLSFAKESAKSMTRRTASNAAIKIDSGLQRAVSKYAQPEAFRAREFLEGHGMESEFLKKATNSQSRGLIESRGPSARSHEDSFIVSMYDPHPINGSISNRSFLGLQRVPRDRSIGGPMDQLKMVIPSIKHRSPSVFAKDMNSNVKAIGMKGKEMAKGLGDRTKVKGKDFGDRTKIKGKDFGNQVAGKMKKATARHHE